jgi:hypothetical protein
VSPPRPEPGDVDPDDLPPGVCSPGGIALAMMTVPLKQWQALVELARVVGVTLETGNPGEDIARAFEGVKTAMAEFRR